MAVEKRIDVVIGGRKDGSLDSTIGGVKASLGSMQGGQTLGGLSQGGTKLLEGGLRLGAIGMAAQGMVGAMELAKAGLELMSGNFDGVNDALQKLPMGLGQAFKAAEELGITIADWISGSGDRQKGMDKEARDLNSRMEMSQQFVEAEKSFRREASLVGLSQRDRIMQETVDAVAKLKETFDNAPPEQRGNKKLLEDAIRARQELGEKKVNEIDRTEAKKFIPPQPQAFQGSSLSLSGVSSVTAAERVATAAEKSAGLAAETVAILRDVRASLGGRSIYDSVVGV